MEKKIILESQKVLVYNVIEASTLSHTKFQWGEIASTQRSNIYVSILKYDYSDFRFQFDFREANHYCIFSPGLETSVTEGNAGGWSGQFDYCRQWLSCIEREISAPDLWSAVEKSRALIESSSVLESNDPFTADEVASISEKLKELERYIRETSQLVEDNTQYLAKRIEYLQESINRMGRRDWFEILKSVLLDLFTKLLPSEVWQSAFQFTSALFNDFFGSSGILGA